MAARRRADIKRKNMSPERVARLEREVKAELLRMSLKELREEASQTQAGLAAAADMSQPQISQIEKQDNHRLSTLRKYVEGLGGELEVVAVLGNKRITLIGV
jgi:DNA-binding XRE family transcriptional regulator